MANGIYKITEDFENALSDYTGAPYVVTVDKTSQDVHLDDHVVTLIVVTAPDT